MSRTPQSEAMKVAMEALPIYHQPDVRIMAEAARKAARQEGPPEDLEIASYAVRTALAKRDPGGTDEQDNRLTIPPPGILLNFVTLASRKVIELAKNNGKEGIQ